MFDAYEKIKITPSDNAEYLFLLGAILAVYLALSLLIRAFRRRLFYATEKVSQKLKIITTNMRRKTAANIKERIEKNEEIKRNEEENKKTLYDF